MDPTSLLSSLGVPSEQLRDGTLAVRTPITVETIARLTPTSPAAAEAALERAGRAFLAWRDVPPPRRGELVRLFGNRLRAHKE